MEERKIMKNKIKDRKGRERRQRRERNTSSSNEGL
jgi:hypothetical protein